MSRDAAGKSACATMSFSGAMLSLLHSLSTWAPIVFIRDSRFGMPAVQSVHLTGLMVFLATMVILDLRLAGFGNRELSLYGLARQLKPWRTGAVTLTILSGLFIFLATPDKYLGSHSFQVKMALFGCAILFHFVVLRRFIASEPVSRSRRINVLVAFLSLTLWFSVGWAGRAIAFIP
jgi:hypothetical protein